MLQDVCKGGATRKRVVQEYADLLAACEVDNPLASQASLMNSVLAGKAHAAAAESTVTQVVKVSLPGGRASPVSSGPGKGQAYPTAMQGDWAHPILNSPLLGANCLSGCHAGMLLKAVSGSQPAVLDPFDSPPCASALLAPSGISLGSLQLFVLPPGISIPTLELPAAGPAQFKLLQQGAAVLCCPERPDHGQERGAGSSHPLQQLGAGHGGSSGGQRAVGHHQHRVLPGPADLQAQGQLHQVRLPTSGDLMPWTTAVRQICDRVVHGACTLW